jgi:hypothetical protein
MTPRPKHYKAVGDEKSSAQALDRTQASPQMIPGRAPDDDPRLGQCLPRHRHQEFVKFLRTIDREVPKDLTIHLIIDNYATHKHPTVRAWLDKHSRFQLH